jgi:hypothetical protein
VCSSAAPTIEAPMLQTWGGIDPRAPEAKVFWFFSSEKNILLT